MESSSLYTELPYRTIVSNIFPFCWFGYSHVHKLEEFELFGYFQRDKFRKIFFLFPNISVFEEFGNTVINFNKIINLYVIIPSPKTMRQIVSLSPVMDDLHSLTIRQTGPDLLLSLFSKKNCFPNLRKLSVTKERGTPVLVRDLSCWMSAGHIWKKIEELELDIPNKWSRDGETMNALVPFFDEPQRKNGFLQNLKKLHRSNVRFMKNTDPVNSTCSGMNNISLNLPRLEYIYVDLRMYKFPFHLLSTRTFDQIKKISFYVNRTSDIAIFEDLLTKSSSTSHVYISLVHGYPLGIDISDTTLDFLFLERKTPLKNLEIYGDMYVSWTRWCEKRNSFLCNIEFLRFHFKSRHESIDRFEENFVGNAFPKLKKLVLERVLFTGAHKFLFAENLVEMEIAWVEKFSDLFFQLNHCKNLKKLNIQRTLFMKTGELEFAGKDWKFMKNLESFLVPKRVRGLSQWKEFLKKPPFRKDVVLVRFSF